MPTETQRELFEAALFPELQRHVVDSLCAVARARPLAPLYVVAPTRIVVDHLARTTARERARVLHLRHLSWESLATALTSAERRAEGRARLTSSAAAWQARLFLARERRPRGFFDRALSVRGFRSAMLRCFDELAAAGLSEADFVERFLVRHGAGLRPRVRHLLELLLGYRRSFEMHRDDRAALLTRASQVPPGRVAAALQTSHLWIYGFEELAVLELRLLHRLAGDRGLHLHVLIPHPAARQTGLGERLRRAGFTAVAPPPQGALPAASMQAISAPGEEAEALEVARRIVQAADDGVPYERIAVVARQAKALALVHRSLVESGVPCTLLAGTSLARTATGRAVAQFLELLETGLRPAPVLAFLVSAPLRWSEWCGIEDDPTPSAWERVAHTACLGHGLRDWQPKLRRAAAAAEERARARRAADEPGRREEATAHAASELLEVAQRLDRDLRGFPRRARWNDFVSAAQEFVEAAFVRGREMQAVLEVLQRLRDLDGLNAQQPTRLDFRDLARNLLLEGRLHEQAAARPGVWVGTAAELYGLDFDVVCLVGLQEGEWPASASEDPILADAERRVLSEALGEPGALRPGAARVERDRRSFRAAVKSARRAVHVSFARLDPSTAATRLPSTLLMELAEEREGRELDFAAFETLEWIERVPLRRREPPRSGPVLSLPEFDALVLASLANRSARRYVRRLGAAPARALALDTMRNRRARFTAYDGWLRTQGARRSLHEAFAGRVYSASQLATYTTCPFRFFMRHALRVEPLDRDEHRELNALEVGRLVHRTLELFYRELARDGPPRLGSASFEALRAVLARVLDSTYAEVERQGRQGARLLWEIRKRHLCDDLLRFLRHEVRRSEAEGAWVPTDFEFKFGPGCESTLEIEPSNRATLAFRGSIDRIDRHSEHNGLRVIDYKSGRKACLGRNPQAVQLVLYLWAACAGDAARLRRSEARFVYVTRRGGFDVQSMSGARVQARSADLVRLASAVADGVEAGSFLPQPGPNATHCTVCDYRTVCDVRIAHQAAFKSRAGQDAAHRALPDFGEELDTLAPEQMEGR
jgi:CRISPR/Cas system-associated exonuclease Cas4 (RecB family)